MRVKIKADASAAMKILKTNRPLKVGDEMEVDLWTGQKLVHENGDYFEEVGSIEQQKKSAAAVNEDDKFLSKGEKNMHPDKNKMLNKGKHFKTA